MQIDLDRVKSITFADGLVVPRAAILHLVITEGEMEYNEQAEKWIPGNRITVVYVDKDRTIRIRKELLGSVKCETP